MLLNNINHWPQRHEDDCLVACCKMVLDYLGIEKDETWLWNLLTSANGIRSFPDITKLTAVLGLIVETRQHAVVVVGLDDEFIYVNDPLFVESPQPIELNKFMLVWSRRGYQYAIIRLIPASQ